jgi:hypothetical protein
MCEVLKEEGVTYMLPRLEADHAAREGSGDASRANSGSQPVYTSPEEVVIFTMRPWADATATNVASDAAVSCRILAI